MREWLITNGIGGFAASTDKGGMNTRRYHGLLIAALQPPHLRTMILSKVDESIEINGKKYQLFTNDSNGTLSKGYKYQKEFQKEILPIYTYMVDGVIIQKTISMIYGKNTVVVVYKIANKKANTKLELTPLVNFRDFHSDNQSSQFDYGQDAREDKTQVIYNNGYRLNLYVSNSKFIKHNNDMFYRMHYQIEEERGFTATENHMIPGTFEVNIKPNADVVITFVAGLESGRFGTDFEQIQKIDGSKVISEEVNRVKELIKDSKLLKEKNIHEQVNALYLEGSENSVYDEHDEVYKELVRKYIIASDNFIIKRDSNNLYSLIAGYPWFLDWGRDAFIAFEGLLLISKRYDVAKEVLLNFANSIQEGIIPNGFDEYTDNPLYNSVDASLLFINAVQKYLDYTGDYKFVMNELFKYMKDIIDYYVDGTNFSENNIYLDRNDYLLVSGTPYIQNTWMDAKVENRVITPRNGKAVEINALWYNALRIMEDLVAKNWKKPISKLEYGFLARKCKENFVQKFYNKNKKCLYDVILVDKEKTKDEFIKSIEQSAEEQLESIAKDRKDDKIRPNQLFALSLKYPVLDLEQDEAKNVFITVTGKLLNKFGLKTLAEGEEGYTAIYKGGPVERDEAYHQGITWPWLLGLYYDALKNLINANDELTQQELSRSLIQFRTNVANTFLNEMLNGNTIDNISEIYDSENPKCGKGCFAQAWSISEVFRIIFGK